MALWLIDSLLTPEEEAFLIENNAITFSTPLPDLTYIGSEHALRQQIKEFSPEETPERIGIDAERIWKFLDRILPDDIVAMVCGEGQTLRIAEVTGPYFYNEQAPETLRHMKPVNWLREEPLPLSRALKDYKSPVRPRIEEIIEDRIKDRILSPIGLSRKRALRYIPWIISGFLLMRLLTMVIDNLRTAGVL